MPKKIALILSDRLGDSLIGMVAANNLVAQGNNVVVFNTYIHSLKAYFEQFQVQPSPTENLQKDQVFWNQFDRVVVMFDRPFVALLRKAQVPVEVMSDAKLFKAKRSMVSIQAEYCANFWGVKNPTQRNGMVVPTSKADNSKVVAIHPTSADSFKEWPKQKFIALANRLKDSGFKPIFILAPFEVRDWVGLPEDMIVSKPDLAEVAEFLTSCDYFIGSDSGIGHLASSIGLPTVSLCIRAGTARMWAPAWEKNEAVLAPAWLFCRPLKDKFWKQALTVSRVLKAFNRITHGS
ncbi:glycosyltransferase family 9 protein [Gilvimarinus chinensis]|uniref:glycosyltransferase family 9 protein n=1 Tax=Gilvimarinus chinensis TaxID=396005 RepID=UPI00037AB0F2|nr:glycosyltransferase family 9 protein [Gilvimarinus chinensis]